MNKGGGLMTRNFVLHPSKQAPLKDIFRFIAGGGDDLRCPVVTSRGNLGELSLRWAAACHS
jgi:hypothetical protein